MISVTASIPLTDYVKTKIGPETGRGHKGYLDSLLVVASKVTTPEQAKDIQESIDAVASAVKFGKKYSLRGQSGKNYTTENFEKIVFSKKNQFFPNDISKRGFRLFLFFFVTDFLLHFFYF